MIKSCVHASMWNKWSWMFSLFYWIFVQIMLPEAIAIVMAPKDSSRLNLWFFCFFIHWILLYSVLIELWKPRFDYVFRTHGIFRLTSGGMTVIRQCPRRGFHSHDPTSDGSPIYRHCTDVYMNSSLKFDVIDLRWWLSHWCVWYSNSI